MREKNIPGVWRQGAMGEPISRSAFAGAGFKPRGIAGGGCTVWPLAKLSLGREVLVSVWRLNELGVLWEGWG